MKYFGPNSAARFWENIKTLLQAKYDKAGGEITGLPIFKAGTRYFIQDEDYDSGVNVTGSLTANDGTVLTLQGYANAVGSSSTYKPIIRNIASPNHDYDVANKKYVDEHNIVPEVYFVFLNNDGTVDSKSSSLTYTNVAPKVTAYNKAVYLDVIIGTTRFYVKASEMSDVNNGPVRFVGLFDLNGNIYEINLALDQYNVLTSSMYPIEREHNKIQDMSSYTSNTIAYPSTKAVNDYIMANFQRKPVVIWETDGTTGLLGLNANVGSSISWQLTNLDFSPYKRIKIHAKAAGTSNTNFESAKTMEVLLDSRGVSPSGVYVESAVFQNPNDSNRLATLTCAVSADKTSFAVMRMTSLYGTAATSNNGNNAYVYLIEGYYD